MNKCHQIIPDADQKGKKKTFVKNMAWKKSFAQFLRRKKHHSPIPTSTQSLQQQQSNQSQPQTQQSNSSHHQNQQQQIFPALGHIEQQQQQQQQPLGSNNNNNDAPQPAPRPSACNGMAVMMTQQQAADSTGAEDRSDTGGTGKLSTSQAPVPPLPSAPVENTLTGTATIN